MAIASYKYHYSDLPSSSLFQRLQNISEKVVVTLRLLLQPLLRTQPFHTALQLLLVHFLGHFAYSDQLRGVWGSLGGRLHLGDRLAPSCRLPRETGDEVVQAIVSWELVQPHQELIPGLGVALKSRPIHIHWPQLVRSWRLLSLRHELKIQLSRCHQILG